MKTIPLNSIFLTLFFLTEYSYSAPSGVSPSTSDGVTDEVQETNEKSDTEEGLPGENASDEKLTSEKLTSEVPSTISKEEAAQIEEWIEQLSESSLTKRRKAKTELARAGAAAIPFLAKGALSNQRDVIVYSLEVLGEISRKSKDESARRAARVTLEMLAESDQPSTSERARRMLETEPASGIEAFPKWNDPKSEFSGGGRGMNRSVSVSNVNGMKTIRVEEGGRVTTLRDESRGRIRVSIEEGEETREFVAKNAEDLQRQDAAAYAIYAQQTNGFGGMQALPQMQGIGNFQGGAVGAMGGNVAGNGPQTQQMMIQHLEELKQRLAENPQMVQMLEMQIQALRGQGD
ncbi:MAG: hypothetical protein JNL58_05705 [Planctomyces sp.]|nr:hypothetical protein [Planctomyces sp.]